MPAIKCPYCGHRNFQTSGKCTNCGAPLMSQSSSTADRAVLSYEPPLPPAIPPSYEQMEQATTIEPYKPRFVSPAIPTTARRPVARVDTDLDPYRGEEYVQTIVTEDRSLFRPIPAPAGKFPWWFPRRAPDITGQVIQVQAQQEMMQSLDLFMTLLKFIRDMIWMDPHDYHTQNKEKETIFVTSVRIRTSNGAQKDARILGHFTGGNISLGDTVSLWGRKRRGILNVRRGYNHTSQSVVWTRAMTSPVVYLFLFVALVVLILFMMLHHVALPIPFPLHFLAK